MIIGNQHIEYIALTQRVLVVAVANIDIKDWCAYISVVYGVNHNHEWQNIADRGDKLSRDIAALLFPSFATEYMWRK